MNIVRNEKLINRNAKIGRWVSFISLIILAGGMYISFRQPENVGLSLSALLLGFVLSQMGIYYTNRWGRSPRPDQELDAALKGFGKRYTLYHYTSPVAHLLVGPVGIWVLIPKPQRGRITYEKNRWRKRGGGILSTYLALFAQEGLGRPTLEISSEINALAKFLRKKLPDQELPPIQAALVFTHPQVEINAENAPAPTLSAKKLKEFLRKVAKETPLPETEIDKINQALQS